MGKKTVKVYRANKKLLKKLFLGILIAFIIFVVAVPAANGIRWLYLNTWQWHSMSPYDFSIKLPRAYEELDFESKTSNVNLSGFLSESMVEVEDKYVSKKPETVFQGGNILNGISIMVQCLNTEKTTKTLDELAENYYTLIKVYYEEKYMLSELSKERVSALGTEAIKVMVDLTKDEVSNTYVTYLIPLENTEITITFFGKKDKISENIDELENIINQLESTK